jgi:hypothetical protein
MTISSTTRIAGPFTGNGVTTTFPFTYKVFSTADVQVIRLTISTGIETTLTIVTDYTITLNGDQDSNPGGNIVLVAALSALYTLTATSDIANLQPTDLTNQGGFYPEVITDALDRATIQIQQISDIGDRTLKIPISDGALNMELPTASQRINTVFGFDATGLPTVLVPQASSITGNTVIVGTLDVTSATTLQTTLGVTGAATIQGLTVGKGGGTIGTNTVLGASALAANTTGGYNNAFGFNALTTNTTGSYNNAFGQSALYANTTGSSNSAFGQSALSANTTGLQNSAFGYGALQTNITGYSNNAFGLEALNSNTTGYYNNAFGTSALYSNTTGYFNHAFGKSALYNNTTGIENCAFGYETLLGNTTGIYNTAFGNSALRVNVIGNENTAVGLNSLFVCTGNNNTAIGSNAGSSLTTGSNNTFIGRNATGSTATIGNEVSIYNNSVTARFQGAAVAWTFVSDARDKENIENLNFGLNFINQLQPRKFSWNIRNSDIDKGKEASGFIAQELLGVVELQNANCLGLVYTNDPNQFSIAQTNLIPVLVNAIKELDKKFNDYVLTHP